MISKHCGFNQPLFGDNPMNVVLPFACEERLVSWELQAYANDLGDLTDNCGGQQFHGILVVILRKLGTKRKTAGGFRVVGGGNNNMAE
jgi:hypothetical protein